MELKNKLQMNNNYWVHKTNLLELIPKWSKEGNKLYMKHYFNMIQYEKEKDTNATIFKREKITMQDVMEHPPRATTMYKIRHQL